MYVRNYSTYYTALGRAEVVYRMRVRAWCIHVIIYTGVRVCLHGSPYGPVRYAHYYYSSTLYTYYIMYILYTRECVYVHRNTLRNVSIACIILYARGAHIRRVVN